MQNLKVLRINYTPKTPAIVVFSYCCSFLGVSVMATSSTKKREPHYFKIGTQNYSINLVKGNYDQLLSTLGLSVTPPASSESVNYITVSYGLKSGLLFPLRVSGAKGNKRKSAKIYVPRKQIEEAITGLIDKQYGTWKIAEVAPVLKRITTA